MVRQHRARDRRRPAARAAPRRRGRRDTAADCSAPVPARRTNSGSKSRCRLLGQVDGPGRVLQALDRLDPAELVVEPAAGREHQHRVALHFEQAQGFDELVGVEVGMSVAGDEAVDGLGRSRDRGSPRCRRRAPSKGRKTLASARAEEVVELDLEPVERLPERAAPALVPLAPRPAAAIGPPALDAVTQLHELFSWISTSHSGG